MRRTMLFWCANLQKNYYQGRPLGYVTFSRLLHCWDSTKGVKVDLMQKKLCGSPVVHEAGNLRYLSAMASSSTVRCYNCNQIGHFARDCQMEERCFKCNKPGHISKDCEEFVEDICYNCGQPGHMRKDCPNQDIALKTCYRCGEKGHLSHDCPKEVTCYRCGEVGHMSHDCPNEKAGQNKDHRECFSCGERGHLSKDCPNKKRSPRKAVRATT